MGLKINENILHYLDMLSVIIGAGVSLAGIREVWKKIKEWWGWDLKNDKDSTQSSGLRETTCWVSDFQELRMTPGLWRSGKYSLTKHGINFPNNLNKFGNDFSPKVSVKRNNTVWFQPCGSWSRKISWAHLDFWLTQLLDNTASQPFFWQLVTATENECILWEI